MQSLGCRFRTDIILDNNKINGVAFYDSMAKTYTVYFPPICMVTGHCQFNSTVL